MNYTKLFLPKLNPFRLYIYSFKENSIILKTFSQDKLASTKLSNLNSSFAYCNSYNNLFISEGNDFWIINHSSFQIKYKKMPIQKKAQSLIFVKNGDGKIFVVGGGDKKSFYYDLKKNYFINWAETNMLHTNPALINIGDYLYILDSVKNNKLIFERTKLTDNKKQWEIIEPKYDENILKNFPNESFGVSLDSKGKIIFIGGNNINMENNATFAYDINENRISLSNQGTNDNMKFIDKTFYIFDNKYNVGLPEDLDEIKEIAFVDKNEQSLIKTNIDETEKISKNKKYLENNEFINYNKNAQIKQKTNIIKNQNAPKEFGYYMSSYSSKQAKIIAKKNRIDIIDNNKVSVNMPIINQQKIENENEIKIEKIQKEKNEEIKIEENYVDQKIEEQNQNGNIENKEEQLEPQIENQENIDENKIEQNQEINQEEQKPVEDYPLEQEVNNNNNDIKYEEINTDIKQNEENINQINEQELINDNNNILEEEKNIEHIEENNEQQENIENSEQKEKIIEGEEKHEEIEENLQEEETKQEQENINEQNEEEHYEENQNQIINEQENIENKQIENEEENNHEQEEQYQEKEPQVIIIKLGIELKKIFVDFFGYKIYDYFKEVLFLYFIVMSKSKK